MNDCLFCKIINGSIPSNKVYEDDLIYAFTDIAPVAPSHVVIVPKVHIDSINEVDKSNIEAVSHILIKAKEIAKDLDIDKSGYRLVNNCGDDGGQTVNHLHFHLVGGRNMQWPPG